jgi:guanine deaminase
MRKNGTLILIFANEKGTLKQEYQIMSADFMRRAIALGLENVRIGGGGPFAALVVKDGCVVAQGVNCVTTTNDPTAHAEVVAIREACRMLGDFQLSGCDLYTTCEPCPMCLGAIYWARPTRVFYACLAADAAAAGFDDAFIYEELKHSLAERRMPMEQLLRDESLAIFSFWKSQEKKILY